MLVPKQLRTFAPSMQQPGQWAKVRPSSPPKLLELLEGVPKQVATKVRPPSPPKLLLLHSSSLSIAVLTPLLRCTGSRNSALTAGLYLIYLVVVTGFYTVSTSYQPYRQAIAGLLCFTLFAFLPTFAMSTPPALPAPGGNATAALALASATQPEEMVIHSGAATRDGDMSYLEDDFDPCRNDPRRDMPGVLDSRIDISQLNTINFNSVDQRTAQVVVQQGVDPTTLASQLMAAQHQALQSEANALHSEVMERQRDALVSEARDQLASIEQRGTDEISRKNLLLNEQAAQAMSEQKAAQLHVQSQEHRIKELSAELSHVVKNAGLMSTSVEKPNADLQAARSELAAEYRTQTDAMNQHALNMKRLAESQKRDFEVEIEKLRTEQKELIRSLKLDLKFTMDQGVPIRIHLNLQDPSLKNLMQVTGSSSTHLMRMMSIFWQIPSSRQDFLVEDLLMIMTTTPMT